MTATLLALYKKPDDIPEFDSHYTQVHIPLAEKMPGLIETRYHKIIGSPMGNSAYHLLAELTFESREALETAMASAEGKAAAKDLMGFAGQLVTLMIAEPAYQSESRTEPEACSL